MLSSAFLYFFSLTLLCLCLCLLNKAKFWKISNKFHWSKHQLSPSWSTHLLQAFEWVRQRFAGLLTKIPQLALDFTFAPILGQIKLKRSKVRATARTQCYQATWVGGAKNGRKNNSLQFQYMAKRHRRFVIKSYFLTRSKSHQSTGNKSSTNFCLYNLVFLMLLFLSAIKHNKTV